MNLPTRLGPEPSYSVALPMAQPAEAAKSPMLIFSIVRRRKLSILVTAALLSALVVAGASRMKPSYVADASVLLQQHSASAVDVPTDSGLVAIDSVALRTQSDILRSADLARNIVRDNDLADLPEFSPATGGTLSKILAKLGIHQPVPPPMAQPQREELAADILLGMITVLNDGRSNVIDIKVKVTAANAAAAPHAAALSAQIANLYADAYVTLTGRMKSDSIRRSNGMFDDRISLLKDKMRDTALAVQNYRSEHNLIGDSTGADGPVTITGQQLAQLNSDLVAATADRARLEASLQQASTGRANLASIPEVVASPLIQGLRERQAELGGKEASLALTRGSNSADLLEVRAAERDVAFQINAETAKIIGSLRSGVSAAAARVASLKASLGQLQSQVGDQGQLGVKLRELQNEADIARTIYTTYLQRSEETATQIDMQEPDALVLSRAAVPFGPAPPSKKQVVTAGVLLSAALATLLALVRERMQGGFRTAEQLESSIGVQALALVPKVRNPRAALRFDGHDPAFAEAINSARAMLRLRAPRGAQVVMITSAIPREGKTFFSSSLARNAACAGERVLLIDCDLRRSEVTHNVDTTQLQAFDHGMIRRDKTSSLDVITITPGNSSPQNLFASPRMRELITMMRERYDLIVLDTPPILAVSDARVLAALSDVTILVVRWQSTPQHLVNAAAAALRSAGAQIAGTVITQAKLRELDAADGAYAYFYGS